MKMNRTVRRIAFALAGLFLIGILLAGFCYWYIGDYASRYLYNDVSVIPANKVGLLLGTSKKLSDGRHNLYFDNRIQAAVELYQAGKVHYLLVSGDNGSQYYNEPLDMKHRLMSRNIPDSVIYLDHAGFRTFDSVIRSHKIFGQTAITIISQKFHNERALYIARTNGINAIGYNAGDVDAYMGFKTRVRELLARAYLFIDLYILKTQPKYLGEPIPIGKAT